MILIKIKIKTKMISKTCFKFFILCLFLIGINQYSFSQSKKIQINKGERGVIYNKETSKFFTDSVLMPGKHLIKGDKKVFIVSTKKQKAQGSIPLDFKNGGHKKFKFEITYVLNKKNIANFIKLFVDSPYERTYLIPKVEKLFYKNTREYEISDLKSSKYKIVQKVINSFNSDPELNKHFRILNIDLIIK